MQGGAHQLVSGGRGGGGGGQTMMEDFNFRMLPYYMMGDQTESAPLLLG